MNGIDCVYAPVAPPLPMLSDPGTEDRDALLRDLEDPELGNRLELHYQPLRSMATGSVVGAEALLRWHREGDVLPAASFIELAASVGRISELELWSLEHALWESRVWRDAGWEGWVSINLSGPSLLTPGFGALIRELVDEAGASPEQLVFEITEGAALAGNGVVLGVLADLRALGARIALDDFGTGFANFEMLRESDPDVIKLDRTFVDAPGGNGPHGNGGRGDGGHGDHGGIGSARFLAALVDLAHTLGKPVVVEGVEKQAQLDRAAASGCEMVQGYLLGRPVPGPTFARRYITRHHPPTGWPGAIGAAA